ncbi:class I SAM-dependent methyltransferase [Microbacterium sp. XT11]|uniref:class I SAM-dependent methyltransferase n=1 Tax=Microbacterium sp. XT11 TaxID=367477 RepID=UPI000742F07D|nr:class I SAM-dependent methyltransferase [Microbacterium sp. XT11]ALX66888.1 hypothetical protein AB663_002389 [Microbacterium sp. XT11]
MAHETLARSFEGIGAEYDRFRPGFPDGALHAVLPERVGRVLDLGAGTGKFTRLLVPWADEVVAVEPSHAMLGVLRDKVAGVVTYQGGAENIPLADASVDAVTVAQAFHWFDRDAACAEIARVLRADGVLGLIWNRSDVGCAWDRACHRLLHPAVGSQDDTTSSAAAVLPGFAFEQHREIAWTERISRDDYVGRWTTVSSYLVAPPERRSRLIEAISLVIDTDPDTAGRSEFDLPHVTDVFVYRRA